MRCAVRNKQTFWYALYEGREPMYDEYGNEIGYALRYGAPVECRGNVSPARGAAATAVFGRDEEFTCTLVVERWNTPINELAILWIGVRPEMDGSAGGSASAQPVIVPGLKAREDGTYLTPWNHTVVRVARGLPYSGCAVIALRKVDVS